MKLIRKTALLLAVVLAIGIIPGLACDGDSELFRIVGSDEVPLYSINMPAGLGEITGYAKRGELIGCCGGCRENGMRRHNLSWIEEKYLQEISYDHDDNLRWGCVVGCDEFVTLREEPDTSAAEIMKLPLGTAVNMYDEIEGSEFTYCSLAYAEGSYDPPEVYGYVLTKYLREIPEESISSLYAADYTVMRDEPNDTATEIMRIEPGKRVDALHFINGYAECVVNGRCGYIPAKNLKDTFADREPLFSTQSDTFAGVWFYSIPGDEYAFIGKLGYWSYSHPIDLDVYEIHGEYALCRTTPQKAEYSHYPVNDGYVRLSDIAIPEDVNLSALAG